VTASFVSNNRPRLSPKRPPPAIGPEDVDNEEALDELVDGKNELCVQLRKGVDDRN
jgi:hypothetical protein